MALSEACEEAIYLKTLINEILCLDQPIVIFSDNQSSLKLSHDDTYHSRTKHIYIRHHFIRHSLTNKSIKLDYISTNHMVADILTKPVPKIKLYKHIASLGMTI